VYTSGQESDLPITRKVAVQSFGKERLQYFLTGERYDFIVSAVLSEDVPAQ